MIRCAAQWWNSSRTLIISPVTTQILLPYNRTDCATALYIYTWDRTFAPVVSSIFATITHRLRDFYRFW